MKKNFIKNNKVSGKKTIKRTLKTASKAASPTPVNLQEILSNNAGPIERHIPKVGQGGLGGIRDISLGFSFMSAMSIAHDVLKALENSKRIEIAQGIIDIFEKWKMEFGLPPKKNLVGILFGTHAEKNEITEEERTQSIKNLEPWVCSDYANNPIRLFKMLCYETKYAPLLEYLNQVNAPRYDYILAVLIILSEKPMSEYQPSECIETGLELASLRMEIQKSLIETATPLAQETFKRRQNAKIHSDSKKRETERRILELHQKYESEGKNPPYKSYAAELGISQPTVSRTLKKNGLGKYKRKENIS